MSWMGGGFLRPNAGGGGGTPPPPVAGNPEEFPVAVVDVPVGTDTVLSGALPSQPVNVATVLLIMNNVIAVKGVHWQLQGATNQDILWLGTSGLALNAGGLGPDPDVLTVRYES